MPAPATAASALDLARYWEQADPLMRFIATLLLAMSLTSWFFIFYKAHVNWRVRRAARAIDAFWHAPTIADGVALLSVTDTEDVFAALARSSAAFAPAPASLGGAVQRDEQVVRLLRQQIHRSTRQIESGLTLLASIGATAPFVGLLGTVWGIHQALLRVSGPGVIEVGKVAGPVGEALVMTGVGLVVAIPAVLAYNAFNRINRTTLAELDGFAHDLHAYFTRPEAA